MTEPAEGPDVLLVEDDLTLAETLMHFMRSKELTLEHAADVDEAKRLLRRRTYKILLLDLVLGSGTAFDVIAFIKTLAAPPATTVIITGAEASALAGLDRAVVSTVLFKPLDLEQLASYVHVASLRADRQSEV